MREYEMEPLQKDIVIPGIVKKKTDLVLEQIRAESRGKDRHLSGRTIRTEGRKFWTAVAVAAAAMGAVTACTAACLHWSRGLEEELHVTQGQKKYLEDKKIAAPAQTGSGMTSAGVTVTPVQSIVDSHFAFLSFQVEGYDLQEGKEPLFEDIEITVNGRDDISWSASFFDGTTTDDRERRISRDGTPIEELPDGSSWEQYMAEDKTMELDILMMCHEAGVFINAPVHVKFSNLGTVHKAEFFPDLEGVWELDVNLAGSDQVRHVKAGKEIGDSKVIVSVAEISPISLQVTYEIEAQPEKIEGVGEDSLPVSTGKYKEPPILTGVRLKDGTLLIGICNGGMATWDDMEKGIYRENFATSKVIDIEQVDGLLYLKSDLEGETVIDEEHLYIVPVE